MAGGLNSTGPSAAQSARTPPVTPAAEIPGGTASFDAPTTLSGNLSHAVVPAQGPGDSASDRPTGRDRSESEYDHIDGQSSRASASGEVTPDAEGPGERRSKRFSARRTVRFGPLPVAVGYSKPRGRSAVDEGDGSRRPLVPIGRSWLATTWRPVSGFVMVVAKRAVLLWILLAVVFVAVDLLPGDAARATAERGESAADVARRRAELGLDRPVLERFWDWMSGLPRGDLGISARGVPVRELVSGAFPNTLLLGGLALALTALCSLALAGWAALRPGGWVDRVVSGTATAVLALPEFVVAIALVAVLSLWTGWLPAVTLAGADGAPAAWDMLVLPVLALAIPQTGWNVRIARAALADEAREPHVEAAVLDGLSPARVLLRHVLPGALPAIVAGLATSTGMLLGGAVAVEVVFNYPGIGTVLASAATDRDAPLVAGVTALTGAVITVVLLIADITRDVLAGGRR